MERGPAPAVEGVVAAVQQRRPAARRRTTRHAQLAVVIAQVPLTRQHEHFVCIDERETGTQVRPERTVFSHCFQTSEDQQ